jgi:hypothetical protein
LTEGAGIEWSLGSSKKLTSGHGRPTGFAALGLASQAAAITEVKREAIFMVL